VIDERVFVVPRAAIPDEAGWYGLRTDGLDAFVAAVERAGLYASRAEMEQDPTFKQIIPYLVLRDGARYFLMQRTMAGGDSRLHDRFSIGVGGHLNPGDGGLLGGLRREWAEELVADFEPAFRLIALLNDDTTPVGSVHLGAVYLADAGGRPVAIRETHKLWRVRQRGRGRRSRRPPRDLASFAFAFIESMESAGYDRPRRRSR
jgi:predicted NUDIX family phosphoesterase